MRSRRITWALAGLVALFLFRMAFNVDKPISGCDEAHCCAAAARLVAHGGPLYSNVLTNYGPVVYWMVAAGFRLGGLYNVVAVRWLFVGWLAVTGLAVHCAARALLGRRAALAGTVHAAAWWLDYSPHVGLSLGAAAWVLAHRRPLLPRTRSRDSAGASATGWRARAILFSRAMGWSKATASQRAAVNRGELREAGEVVRPTCIGEGDGTRTHNHQVDSRLLAVFVSTGNHW